MAAAIERAADSTAIVVSGGSTPLECLQQLSRVNLQWRDVRVFLSDERWVSSQHESSNEKMVRRELLQGAATAAELVPVFREQMLPSERCSELQRELPEYSFAISMLGMGTDGHFASLFSDAGNIDIGLDELSSDFYVPIETSGSPHVRVSMTLSALVNSAEILLLIFGDEKRAVLEQARSGDASLPVTALMQNATSPIHVVWAP